MSDTQGAVIADGPLLEGVQRGALRPAWSTKGNFNGVACVTTCASAYVTFADRAGLYLGHDGVVTRVDLPKVHGDLRVLLAAAGSVVLIEAQATTSRLLLWQQGSLTPIRVLEPGSPVWRTTSNGGTLYMLGENTTMALTIEATATGVDLRPLGSMPHGVICDISAPVGEAQLPDRAYDTLRTSLGELFNCTQGPDGLWIGSSNYLADGGEGEGQPFVDVAVTDSSAKQVWARTFSGERFEPSPDNGVEVLASGDRSVMVIDTRTGAEVKTFGETADAEYVGAAELAAVDFSGHVRWLTYEALG